MYSAWFVINDRVLLLLAVVLSAKLNSSPSESLLRAYQHCTITVSSLHHPCTIPAPSLHRPCTVPAPSRYHHTCRFDPDSLAPANIPPANTKVLISASLYHPYAIPAFLYRHCTSTVSLYHHCTIKPAGPRGGNKTRSSPRRYCHCTMPARSPHHLT